MPPMHRSYRSDSAGAIMARRDLSTPPARKVLPLNERPVLGTLRTLV